MEKLTKKIMMTMIVGCMVLGITGVSMAKKAPNSSARKINIDLIAKNLKITKTGMVGGANRVSIKATTLATAAGNVCSGPFKIRVDWTTNPTAGWHALGESGIANLCVNSSRAALPAISRSFHDTVPGGEARKYRFTVDFRGDVSETSESNNVKSAGYISR